MPDPLPIVPPMPVTDRYPVDLVAVVISASRRVPQVLVIGNEPMGPDRLPAGPLAASHRTLEAGLRAWVGEQTQLGLGYVEQLYTFGDLGRIVGDGHATRHDLSIAYLALVRDTRPSAQLGANWRDWYAFFPWEDWREGRPKLLDGLLARLGAYVAMLDPQARQRTEERIALAFGVSGGLWSDERVLDRYELLYEAGLARESGAAEPIDGRSMAHDHRRILATAVSRLRSKIQYRPVIFELMPDSFTLLDLQETVEALSGKRLHKQNFRRLIEAQGLVEETGELAGDRGGRPARLVRFRREVLRERPAPGVRLPSTRRSAPD